jgi:DNA-binding transcriptional MerR regulator
MAVLLGVSVKTLQRWDKSGKLVARRNEANRRYYTEADLFEFKKGLIND